MRDDGSDEKTNITPIINTAGSHLEIALLSDICAILPLAH
jgi:hypothetical protein